MFFLRLGLGDGNGSVLDHVTTAARTTRFQLLLQLTARLDSVINRGRTATKELFLGMSTRVQNDVSHTPPFDFFTPA